MTNFGNGSLVEPKSSASGAYGADRGGGRKHAGKDYLGYTDLKSITDGVVTSAGILTGAAGETIAIDLPQKIEGCTVTIVRMHMKAGSFKVKPGDRVKAGQSIGTMGNTGNAEGNCDHVEIRYWKGGVLIKTVDPGVWIASMIKAEHTAASKTRKVLAHTGSNGRMTPSTGAKVAQVLKPGTVGTFNGYRHAQKVEGNDVWFRGAFSGNWFWSGGFEGGANISGLPAV